MSYKLYLMSIFCVAHVGVTQSSQQQRPSTAQRQAWAAFGADDGSHTAFSGSDYTPEWNDPRSLGRVPSQRVVASVPPVATGTSGTGREVEVTDREERNSPAMTVSDAEPEGSAVEGGGGNRVFASVVPREQGEVRDDERSQANAGESEEQKKLSCCQRLCALFTCGKKT